MVIVYVGYVTKLVVVCTYMYANMLCICECLCCRLMDNWSITVLLNTVKRSSLIFFFRKCSGHWKTLHSGLACWQFWRIGPRQNWVWSLYFMYTKILFGCSMVGWKGQGKSSINLWLEGKLFMFFIMLLFPGNLLQTLCSRCISCFHLGYGKLFFSEVWMCEYRVIFEFSWKWVLCWCMSSFYYIY